MKISSRYNVLGKKKFVTLPKSIDDAKSVFDKAVNDRSVNRKFVCSANKKTGAYKFYYKISEKRGDLYETYSLIADIFSIDDNTTKIEYCFVFDRLIYLYTKILSALCFVIPIVVGILAAVLYKTTSLFIYIPLALVAIFGICAFFAFKENKQDVEPIVGEFKKFIVELYGGDNQSTIGDVTSGINMSSDEKKQIKDEKENFSVLDDIDVE